MRSNTRWWACAIATIVVVTLTALLTPQLAEAQVLYGTLRGNVTDSSGGVAGGVKVQALNVGTNVAKNTTTDSSGVYLFRLVTTDGVQTCKAVLVR